MIDWVQRQIPVSSASCWTFRRAPRLSREAHECASLERLKMRKHGVLNLNLRTQVAIVLFFALCMSPAVVAQKVTSDYDKVTDFSGFKTYAWGEGMSVPNPNLDLYIKMVVDQDFETHGLKKVEAKEADLIVAYQWASDTDLNVSSFSDPTYATSGGVPMAGTTMWSSGSTAGSVGSYITKGTLALEIYDRRQGKTVWEAAAKGTVKEKMGDRMKQLQKILPKLLERYPPKKK